MRMGKDWLLPGASSRGQSVTADWRMTDLQPIDGVRFKEVKHVPTEYGRLTEIFRLDWGLDEKEVGQVFQLQLAPGFVSAWHAHESTTDRLFVNSGLVKLVLFDGRPQSPTQGRINEFRVGDPRPTLISIPPKVWHGLKNIGIENAHVLNLVDQAYDYEEPDHWSLPPDTAEIPYRF